MSASILTIEKAAKGVERTGRLSRTVSFFAAFVALGLTTASLGPTLSGLAEQTHVGLSIVSYLFTARSLGFLVGALGAGKLYDRVPGHLLMACALILMALMMALVPFSSSFLFLFILMVALGAAESTLDVGGNTLLVWMHTDRVAPFMNGLHFFYGVGAFLSPVVVAQALRFGLSGSLSYRALALLVLPIALWMLRPTNSVARPKAEENLAGRVNRKLLFAVALFFFLYLGAEVSFGGWIYTYAVALKLSDAMIAAYLTSAFWGSLTIGRLLSIPLTARFRPRTILIGALLGSLSSVAFILLLSNSALVLWLGTFGVGLSMAAIFPTTLSWAERRMKITGQVTGWFLVGASLGGMFLPWLVGQLFEVMGARVTMLVIMCDLVMTFSVFILLTRFPQTERG